MPGRSVKLKFEDGGVIYISPKKARELRKSGAATVASQQPFVLKLKAGVELIEGTVQRWTPISDGRVMSGAILERRPPRL